VFPSRRDGSTRCIRRRSPASYYESYLFNDKQKLYKKFDTTWGTRRTTFTIFRTASSVKSTTTTARSISAYDGAGRDDGSDTATTGPTTSPMTIWGRLETGTSEPPMVFLTNPLIVSYEYECRVEPDEDDARARLNMTTPMTL